MKELVVLSGKGGTGKTSIVGAFAALAERKVLADCDVDAADLHLILEPRHVLRGEFSGGHRARIDTERCTGCGTCLEVCEFGAISRVDGSDLGDGGVYEVQPTRCEGCSVCVRFCPERAVMFEPVVGGEWFVSQTRFGPMVHARLGIAQENSGRLVTLVRQQAGLVAAEEGQALVIIDGPPGIGCPVIAAMTGADLVLAVTEPTRSGLHDLERVRELAGHFKIPLCVCINKHDLNPSMTAGIKAVVAAWGARLVGMVRYDPEVVRAQIDRSTVIEHTDRPVARDIRTMWDDVRSLLGMPCPSDAAL
jgi:MinD superfamily P-loop ATPase